MSRTNSYASFQQCQATINHTLQNPRLYDRCNRHPFRQLLIIDKYQIASQNRDMSTSLPEQIQQFLEHLEIEKNASKLTIRDYRHYLDVFSEWYATTLPDQSIEKLNLDAVRKYRVHLANKVDEQGLTLQRVTQN